MRTIGLIVCTVAAIGAFQPGISWAEDFPARPLTMIVPYPPAGPVDVIARIIAERMAVALGQPVVVDNVPGAGGSVGVARAARAAPDGYTLSVGDWTSHVASQVIYAVHYDVRQDFRPVSLLSISPQLIVGRSELPFDDLAAVIAALKANPESMTAATVGPGSNPHMCGISLQERTGIRLRFVPYRGGAQAIQDLLAGRVDLMCSDGTNVLEHLRAGRLRAYAVLSKARWDAAPDIPTIDEAGLVGFYITQWRGLWAPRATPTGIIEKIHAATIAALRDPDVRKKAEAIGQQMTPQDQQTADALGTFHEAEITRWWPIIKAANIGVQ